MGAPIVRSAMATVNPFDLLGDDDNDDPAHLLAAQEKKVVAKKPAPAAAGGAPAAAAKMPSKPLPPSQAGELVVLILGSWC